MYNAVLENGRCRLCSQIQKSPLPGEVDLSDRGIPRRWDVETLIIYLTMISLILQPYTRKLARLEKLELEKPLPYPRIAISMQKLLSLS